MSDTERRTASKQFVTAFFDSRTEAEAAAERVAALGIPSGDIRMVAGDEPSGDATADTKKDKGFFEALADFLMPDEDRHTYAEGLNRGGYLVSVNTTANNRDRVVDILDDEGTVDMDEREASWRADGWKGFRTDSSVTGHIKGSHAGAATDEESPVVDEQMQVGKRQADAGRARVRSYEVDKTGEE